MEKPQLSSCHAAEWKLWKSFTANTPSQLENSVAENVKYKDFLLVGAHMAPQLKTIKLM